MKKLLSLLLAAGMLASVCIPTVYAVEPSAPLYSAEEMPDEIPSAGPAAPLTTSDQLMEQLSFEVTPDGGTPFNSTAPFQEMTMVVGRSYTFQVKLSEKPLSDLDYTLKDVRFDGTTYDPCYLTASNLNENAGTFVTTATGAASGFLGNMQLTFMQDDSADTAVTLTIRCLGTVVTDSGNLLFCNESGAEISTLDVDAAHKEFTLSIGGFALNESTMEIDYATTAPDFVSWDEEDQEFGTVRLTVSQAVLTGSTFTATIKDKTTQEVLATAVLTLRWINEVSSGTLPDGSTVCFGIKGPDSYQPYSASQYTQTAGLSSPDSVQIFFSKSEGGNIRYFDQPEGNSLASIQVISLSPEVVTIDSQTQPTDDTPFTCTFHVDLENCTTAQLQATVTLQDGTTATSLFTINIVEAVSAKEVTVNNTDELKKALSDTSLPYGSTIYLEPDTYTGDFVVSRPVNLIASQYNGTLPLYDKDGAVMPDSNAVVIDGTITANVPNVEVFGLRFENKGTAANRTALTDATLVTGCTFTGYDTAVALSTNSSAIGTNYRILKNAFVGNTTALRFEKSEWKSMIQDNSFLNNDTAIELAFGCFVDGAASSNVYGKNVNGGKWNNNFFRGADNQKALNDERSEGATLLLNYNYYKYGTVAGAQDRLFTSQACDHSVFYTTPELTAVSTEVSLTELTKQGGLDLVAQQQDTTKNDNALNVSSDLFDKLKNDTDAENLTLNVWSADEQLAAVWNFPKEDLTESNTSNVNLGVRDTLDTDEQAVVNANLPAGTDSQSIHFMHDGVLPGTATVEVPLTESGLNADNLALYYINEKTNSLELVNTDVNVEKQADGTSVLSFDIEHCSSYIVAPKQSIPTKPATEDTTSSSSKDTTSSPAATPSSPAASGGCTVYYVCSACGYHNWTATENGYRCDHCGYLESVKQLSGYGNVKGVYTPKAGSTPASGSAASVVVPATSDESHPMVWVVLLVVAGGAFVGLLIYKKRQK